MPSDWTGEIAAPLRLVETRVKAEWIDDFGHVNIAHYLTICDQANWAFWNWVNAPDAMAARDGREYAIVENHVHYLDELTLDEEIYVTTQLIDCDAKRFILFHRVHKAANDAAAATNEAKFLAFNLGSRRAEAWSETVKARLDAISAAHDALGLPAQAGLGVTLAKR